MAGSTVGSVPMVEIPFFVALPSKHAAAATEAVMQVVTALRALGLPVARLHSDRGGEFVNRSLRLFCSLRTTWPLKKKLGNHAKWHLVYGPFQMTLILRVV